MNPPQLRLLSLEQTLSTAKIVIAVKSSKGSWWLLLWWVGRWRSFLRNPVARGKKICVVVILQLPTISSLERHTHRQILALSLTYKLISAQINAFIPPPPTFSGVRFGLQQID